MKKIYKFCSNRINKYALSAYAAFTTFILSRGVAYAVPDASNLVNQIRDIFQKALYLIGGAFVLWGGIKIALAIKEHQGGAAVAEAAGMLAAGALIIVIAVNIGIFIAWG